MKHTTPLIVFLITLISFTSALGDDNTTDYTGMGLLAALKSQDLLDSKQTLSEAEFGHLMELTGYINGVLDNYSYECWINKKHANSFILDYTLPEHITLGQTMLVIKKYLNDNPDKLNQNRFILITDALKKAFPVADSNK